MRLRGRSEGAAAPPPLSYPSYAVRAPLAAWLAEQAVALDARFATPPRLLDVGCGELPYEPLFRGHVAEYVGLDFVPNPRAQLQGRVEELPVEDASFDLVVCTQVLEHCDDPARAVAELRRVTRAGGRVLASTHGVQVYHPSPGDHWRWTHTGLELLFTRSGSWSSVTVSPGAGTTACLGMLVNCYVDLLAKRLRVLPLSVPLVAAVNRLAAAIDARSELLRSPGPGSLIANYHVVADV